MAAPTPTTWTQWDGSKGATYWHAGPWTDTTNITDSIIVDISTLGGVGTQSAPNCIKITYLEVTVVGDVVGNIEIDATTDALVTDFVGLASISTTKVLDFSRAPSKGRLLAASTAGFVGDILATTTTVASGNEIEIYVEYARKS
jgi:hypothetical protein